LSDAIENNKSRGDAVCPMKVVNCDKIIRDEEIQALLSPEAYQKYLEKLFNDSTGNHQATNTDTVPALLHLEDTEYVETRTKFECNICTSVIRPGDGLTLKNCLHEYCKTCLSKTIELSDEMEVPCPFVAEDGTHCEGVIQDRELRSLVTPEILSARFVKSLERAEAMIKNSFHCKTPDCLGWAEFEEGVTNFNCPVCQKISCIKCKVNHEGKSCTEYYYETNSDARKTRDDNLTETQLRELVTSKKAMACPGCGVIIQKTTGCNHMKCSRCKRDFQWQGLG
jgi:RanBP-type and C3HC4-type zinc finger-containing protein 1